MHLYLFSCFFLASASIVCLLGLVSPRYKENLIECVGMAFLALSCASRTADIWARGQVPFDWFLVHTGIGLVAIGIAVRVFTPAIHSRLVGYQRIWRGEPAPDTDALWAEYGRSGVGAMLRDRRRNE